MTNPPSENGTDEVLWRCASRFHDWADREFPRRLMNGAAAAGIIGPPEWLELDPRGPQTPLRLLDPLDAGASVFAALPDDSPPRYLRTWGGTPHAWTLSMSLSPFDREAGRVDGYNIISVKFPRAPFETTPRSAVLLDCFTRTHSPDDTEFAAVHPSRRWDRLRTSLYDVAVTYDPMFAGVLWANFLGPGHIEQFDPDALARLSAYRVERVGTRGLFVIITPDIADAETPSAEREMQRLTEIFRRAHKP